MNIATALPLQQNATQLPALLEIFPDDVLKDLAYQLMDQCRTGCGWEDPETLLSLELLIRARVLVLEGARDGNLSNSA